MGQVTGVSRDRSRVRRFGLPVGACVVCLVALLPACSTPVRTPASPAAAETPDPGQQNQLKTQLEEAVRQVEVLRKQSTLAPQDQQQAQLKDVLQRVEALEQQMKAKQEQENAEKLAKEYEEEWRMGWALMQVGPK